MSVPDSTATRANYFAKPRDLLRLGDLFQLSSWLQVMWGQGVRPRATHPFVEAIAPHDRAGYLRDLRGLFAKAAQDAAGHAEFIAQTLRRAPPGAA
jgi:tryptophan halogenase